MDRRGGYGASGEKHIVRSGCKWKVLIVKGDRCITRTIYDLEEAKACRDWLISGTGKVCRTTAETYAHPDGTRWAAG